MSTIYCTATSLDGFIADRNNSLDWLMQFGDPGDSFQRFLDGVGALAMGSTTYQWMLDNHVFAEGGPNPWPYRVPAFVFTSRRLRAVPGADIRFVKGDVAPIHAEMSKAAAGKNLWIVGGGELAGLFHDQNLLDEIIVHLASLTLGGGAPLFPRVMKTPMELVEFSKMQKGLIEIRYRVSPAEGSRV